MSLFGPDFRSMNVEELIEYLKKNNKDIVRGKACNALEKVGNKRSILPLIDILNEEKMKFSGNWWLPDQQRFLRVDVIRALDKIYTREKDQRIIKPLINELNFVNQDFLNDRNSCEAAIKALVNINDNDVKKALISIAYDIRYVDYSSSLQDFLKDTLKNPELLPLITEAKRKSSKSTKEMLSSLLSRILPGQTLNAFSIVSYTDNMSFIRGADRLVAAVAATAVLGPLGGIIVGGGGSGGKGYKSGIIGYSDKEFFFIDIYSSFFQNRNGFVTTGSENIPQHFIKRIPLKELKMDFDENSGVFLVSGALNLQFIIGDFVNYLNLENAHFIVNAIKNPQNVRETTKQEKIPDTTKEIPQKQHSEIDVSRSVSLEKNQISPKVIPTNMELRDKRDDQNAVKQYVMQYECTKCDASSPVPSKDCPKCGGPMIGIKRIKK